MRRRKNAAARDLPSHSLLFSMGKGLVLLLVLGLLFGSSHGASSEKMASLEARLQKLEARAAQMEGQMNQIVSLMEQIARLEQSVARLDTLTATKTVARKKKIEPKTVYHVVQPGEILSRIAAKTVIRFGQRLMVSARE